jgi:cob(I)alamin adenosyltransferase
VRSFVLPYGPGGGAELHLARTIARRAERELWALNRVELLRPELLIWLNRLSDLLFALALETNQRRLVGEVAPDYTV